jgi:hypothetical protein
MSHYHPHSYETEARIRQHDKLASARHHRRLKALRAGRSPLRPVLAVLSLLRDGLVATLNALTSPSPGRRQLSEHES